MPQDRRRYKITLEVAVEAASQDEADRIAESLEVREWRAPGDKGRQVTYSITSRYAVAAD